MTMRREVEQDDLPDEAQHALVALDHLKKHSSKGQARRDGYTYTIEYQRDEQPVVVALPEEHVTEEVAPLIRYLESSTPSSS